MDSTELYHIAAIPGSCVNEVVSFTEEIPHIYVTVQESIASTLYLVPYIAAIPELSEERNRVLHYDTPFCISRGNSTVYCGIGVNSMP